MLSSSDCLPSLKDVRESISHLEIHSGLSVLNQGLKEEDNMSGRICYHCIVLTIEHKSSDCHRKFQGQQDLTPIWQTCALCKRISEFKDQG